MLITYAYWQSLKFYAYRKYLRCSQYEHRGSYNIFIKLQLIQYYNTFYNNLPIATKFLNTFQTRNN